MDSQVSKSAEQVADAVSEERRQLDAIETARAIGYRDGHIDGRNEARAQTASAASPVAGVSERIAEITKRWSGVQWNIGRTLDTPRTRQWTQEQRLKNDRIEECLVFSRFSADDDGRSRFKVCEAVYPGTAARIAAAPEDIAYLLKLAQPSAEGDGWIAVTERLPDLDVDVLTYSKHDWGTHVGRQEVDMGNRRIWCEHRIPEPRELPYVTHWRTLPTPPSVQEEKGSSV